MRRGMPLILSRDMPPVQCAKATRTRRPEPTNQRLREGVANSSPLKADIRAHESDGHDGNDRDERGNQDVLDESLAVLVGKPDADSAEVKLDNRQHGFSPSPDLPGAPLRYTPCSQCEGRYAAIALRSGITCCNFMPT